MAGLVPVIHVFLLAVSKEDVDARHKAGHDGARVELALLTDRFMQHRTE
jgi:hypothetical protein